jgi:transposase
MQNYYVGLDVHIRESVFVVKNDEGAMVARGSVPTTVCGLKHLRDSCHLPAGTGVALETGTTAFFVARELVRLELKPVVIDAHEVRRKAHRPEQKSDTRDALELCEGLRRGFYRSIVHVPSPAISELRTALSRRRHFIRIQTAEVNAAKRLLRGIGQPSGPRGNLRTDAHWQRLLAGGVVPEHLEEHVGHHYAVWRQASERVRALDLSLADSARERRDAVKRLETVPGVGPIVALTTIAVFAEVSRFESAKHAASYAGLVPSTFQSGERDAHGHITKRGSAELRAMLCEAAHHARRAAHPLNPHFARVCARHGYKTAVVAVAHRLCRILFAMLRDGTDFSVSRTGVEQGDFKRATTYSYRLRPKPPGRLPVAG